MARKLRLEYPGAMYHAMNRRDRRPKLFGQLFSGRCKSLVGARPVPATCGGCATVAGAVTGRRIVSRCGRDLFRISRVVTNAATRPWALGHSGGGNAAAVEGGDRDKNFDCIRNLAVDERMRMARARPGFANPDCLLEDKMFGTARLLPRQTEGAMLVEPPAIQHIEGRASVFVKLANDRFEARALQLGAKYD